MLFRIQNGQDLQNLVCFSVVVSLGLCACCVHPEDVAWASRGSRSGLPIGTACLLCLRSTRRAFAWRTWADPVTEAEANDQFKEELSQVRKNFETGAQEFILQDYEVEQVSSYETWREYTMVPEAMWREEHGIAPGDIGVECITLKNEKGLPETGILVKTGRLAEGACFMEAGPQLA